MSLASPVLSIAALPTPPAPWENISDGLYAQLPDYRPVDARLYTGVGGLVVTPADGVLFAIMNRDYGVLRSRDQGATWERLPQAPVRGRVYGGFSIALDAPTGRFVVFTQEANPHGINARGGYTLDGGETWTPIERPSVPAKHDGFTWGGLDWTSTAPRVLVAKEHHAWVSVWRSADGGATWEKLPVLSRNVGVLNAETHLVGVDEISAKHGATLSPGIHRSADAGSTWQKVSDRVVTGKAPVGWGANAYWTCDEGVLVSRDLGATWSLLGSPLPGALYGPFFGRTENELLVVADSGFHLTRDAGLTWQKVADPIPGHHRLSDPTVSYGWDPRRGLLYHAEVGGDVYRLRLDSASSQP